MRKSTFVLKFSAAILSILLSMTVIGCPGSGGGGDGNGESGGDPTFLEGVWENPDNPTDKLTISGNRFTGHEPGEDEEDEDIDFRGTFTITGDTIVITVTQFLKNGTWMSRNDFIDAMIIDMIMSDMRMTRKQAQDYWNDKVPKDTKVFYREMIGIFLPTTLTVTYTIDSYNNRLTITEQPSKKVTVYHRAGTSGGNIPPNLVGSWEAANDEIEFTPTLLIWNGVTYFTKVTGKKIEISTSAGSFDRVFCDSYSITNGGELIFSGGKSEDIGNFIKVSGAAMDSAIPLRQNQWKDGRISGSGGEVWYKFEVESEKTYCVWWNDKYGGDGSKTLDAYVSAFYSDESIIFSNESYGWYSTNYIYPTSDDTVYIKVTPRVKNQTGSFGIVYSTSYTRPELPVTLPSNHITLTENKWEGGEFPESDSANETWYSFTATAGAKYNIWWNKDINSNGDGSKTMSVRVSAYYSNGVMIFPSASTGWNNPQSFTATLAGTIYLKVVPSSSGSTGTYGIVFSTNNTRPLDLPSSVTHLIDRKWENGEINEDSGGADWYSFDVVSKTTYRIWWNSSYGGDGSKTLNPTVTAWYSDGTPIFTDTYYGDAWTNPRNFNARSDDTVYIKIASPYSGDYGTYGIVYSSNDARPLNLPSVITELTADQWEDGEITSSSDKQIWYSFNVVNGTTYYVWSNGGSYEQGFKTLNIDLRIWYSDGTEITVDARPTWSYPLEFEANSDDIVYLMVIPFSYYFANTGTYCIAYSTGSTRPEVTLNPPNAIDLTNNQWEDGEISAPGGEQWYSLDVTNGATYRVWWNEDVTYYGNGDGTKTLDVYVSAYYADGTVIFGNTDNGWSDSSGTTFTAESDSKVYLRVISKNSVSTGTFGIVYSSTGDTRPIKPFDPPSNSIALTENVWKDGVISTSSDGEAWYKFNVSNETRYRIWWNEATDYYGDGTKTLDVRVSALYSSGEVIFGGTDYSWNTAVNFTSHSDDIVYVRVYPKTPGKTGTFGIVYSGTSSTRPTVPFVPPAETTTLIESEWKNDEISASSGGEAWYSFEIKSGDVGKTFRFWWDDRYSYSGVSKTLDIRVSAWYSDGTVIFMGVDDEYYTSPITPASAGTIYIRVYPKNSGETGTYRVAYNINSSYRPN